MTSDSSGAPATIEEGPAVATATPPRRRFGAKAFLFLFVGVVALDILAAIVAPPFPKGASPARPATTPRASSIA
ncbi:MAG: hypothetical protein ACXWNR_09685 [Candidatus Limnocylindrales bacterium]